MGKIIRFALLSFLAVASFGCGSASNNDQGVSFTMLGYSIANTAIPGAPGAPGAPGGVPGVGPACATAPNLSGGVFPISTSNETAGSTSEVLAGVVVQNNLTTQFVRTISLSLQYIIPGAQITPPSTIVPYGSVVPQAGGLYCGVVTLVPPQILSWLNLNRASLPELPFLLIVRGQVNGTTQAGDVLTTNPIDIGYTVVADNVIAPTEPDDTTAAGFEGFDDGTGDLEDGLDLSGGDGDAAI